jgi:hypothetical protein
VPQTYECNGFGLGRWVTKQRVRWREGRLDPVRAHRLEAVPGWTPSPRQTVWEDSYSALQRFVQREGHARPLAASVEDGIAIGAWVYTQRWRYQLGKLSPERERRLEALPGWIWDAQEAAWREGYEALCRYTEREGRARPPRGCVESGFQLGSWVHTQRRAHKRGRMDSDRAHRLEALPGWDW